VDYYITDNDNSIATTTWHYGASVNALLKSQTEELCVDKKLQVSQQRGGCAIGIAIPSVRQIQKNGLNLML
jgi:hypothetical protein